jgi:UDP-N-acetylmuramyl-tripeptide synthetase
MQLMKKHDMLSVLKECSIKHITADSRKVVPGSAFFCIQYSIEYIKEAEAKGASLIITALAVDFECSTQIIVVDSVRDVLAQAASFLYSNKPQYIVAVTGTSGKSSVVDYFRQFCEHLGYKAASMGTMGIICADKKIEEGAKQFYTGLNTPDVVTMYKILDFLGSSGITHLAFEASSHGLDQKRIAAVPLCAAGFTSFSQDHLDYHGTMEAYKFAKIKLLSENLVQGGRAIIAEDVMDNEIRSLSNKINITTVGCNGDIKIISSKSSMIQQRFEFSYHHKIYEIFTNIIGSFQATNILISACLVEACNTSFESILDFIPKLTLVPGRLERITPLSHPWHVFVDYAHKPNALESTLKELRKISQKRVIIVFGCGGDRDRIKRAIMGEIAHNLADMVIVCDDNPRTEDPKSIRAEVMKGCPDAIEIADRAEAIKYAMGQLQEGDILILAGKGHENYQILYDTTIYFNDAEEVRKYL